MKLYDLKKIMELIEEHKHEIGHAFVGMEEDWGWTSEEIWNLEDGYKFGDNIEELENDGLFVAGIEGSSWATPVLKLEMLDGYTKTYDVYTDDGEPYYKPPFI